MIHLLMTLAWLTSVTVCASGFLTLALHGALQLSAGAARLRRRQRAQLRVIGNLRPLLS